MITPDSFQTEALAWISALSVVALALSAAVAKVWLTIRELRAKLEEQVKKLEEQAKQFGNFTRRVAPLLVLCFGLGLSGCEAPNTLATGIAGKSNNSHATVTGIKISAYDSTTGLPTAVIGTARISMVTHRDNAGVQISDDRSYSWIPGDSTLSSGHTDIFLPAGTTAFNLSWSSTAAGLSFNSGTAQ